MEKLTIEYIRDIQTSNSQTKLQESNEMMSAKHFENPIKGPILMKVTG